MTADDAVPPPPPAAMGGTGSWLRQRLRFYGDDLLIAAVILLALLAFMLPAVIVTVPAGHLGVLWKRFDGGTVEGSPMNEGTRLILPWDKAFIYDARLQSVTREFEVLSSDGLTLTVDLTWRFRVIPEELGALHQYAGRDYAETLLAPSVGARARDVIALYRPEDVYTVHRLKIQDQIRTTVIHDLRSRFNPSDARPRSWLVLEDIMLKRIVLPPGVQQSIVRKNMARHEVDEYALIVEKEHQETERKRVEALGIRNFQEIVSRGMTEDYLRWRGLEATLELARSNNAKIVIVGNNRTGGLPLISFSADGPVQDAGAATAPPAPAPGAAVSRPGGRFGTAAPAAPGGAAIPASPAATARPAPLAQLAPLAPPALLASLAPPEPPAPLTPPAPPAPRARPAPLPPAPAAPSAAPTPGPSAAAAAIARASAAPRAAPPAAMRETVPPRETARPERLAPAEGTARSAQR